MLYIFCALFLVAKLKILFRKLVSFINADKIAIALFI